MVTKLSPYFVLNSISNQNDLRGVTKHPESGCVIVTFNRNMVSRYKVTEQRPIGSWSTSEGFHAPAVYNEESNQYAALLSKNELRLWTEKDTNILKLKKYIFAYSIWSLITDSANKVFVVSNKGNIQALNEAVASRKRTPEPLISDGETIIECCLELVKDITYFVVLTFNSTTKSHSVYVQKIINGMAEYSNEKLILSLKSKCEMSGMAIKCLDGELSLITLWSNGELYSLPLLSRVTDEESWGTKLAKIEDIRADKKVCIIPVSNRHIAMYGADPGEEGATLLLYNTLFKVVQARQRLKLYSSPPLMWGPFDGQLVVASGHHLLVSRFHLGHETVASMMGSACKRRAADSGGHVQKLVWDPSFKSKSKKNNSVFSSAPESIKDSLITMGEQGLPESEMVLKLSSGLMERRDVLGISWCLKCLREIPESVLVKLASFCLREQDATFAALTPDLPQPPVVDDTSAVLPPESPLVGGRKVLLDRTLNVPFNAPRLLPEIKNHLSPQDALLLLQHISARLWHGDEPPKKPSKRTESQVTQLLAWASTLLDANYQHCLLSMDSQVLRTLTALSDIVDTQIQQIEELRTLEPLILRMLQGRRLPKPKHEDRIYSIETVHLL